MAKGYNLGDLRAAIDDTIRQVLDEQGSGVAPNDIVLARLKRERSTLVDAFAPQLTDMALTKLLNDEARRKRSNGSLFFQDDMFVSYPKLPNLLMLKRGIKKDPGSLTLREAKMIVDRRKKKDIQRTQDDLERIVSDCESLSPSDDEILREIVGRMSKAKEILIEPNLTVELETH